MPTAVLGCIEIISSLKYPSLTELIVNTKYIEVRNNLDSVLKLHVPRSIAIQEIVASTDLLTKKWKYCLSKLL